MRILSLLVFSLLVFLYFSGKSHIGAVYCIEPERPRNAMDYVKKYLGAPASVDIDGLKRENEDLRKQLDQFQEHSDAKHH